MIANKHTPLFQEPMPALEPVADDATRRQRLLEAQAERIIRLQEEISTRKQQLDELKSQVLDQWEPGTYKAGDLTVRVNAGRRTVSPVRFQEAYPVDKHPECYQVKPLPLSRIERLLGETAVADYVTTTARTVTVS